MSGAARVFAKGDRVIFRPGQAEVYGEAPGKVYTVLRTYPHKRYKRTWVDLDDRGMPGGTVDSKELRPAPRERFIGTATVVNPGHRGRAHQKRRRATRTRSRSVRSRRNPRYSETSLLDLIRLNAEEIRQDAKRNSWEDIRARRIIAWAETLLKQVSQGVHENPAIAVLGNPGGGVAGTIAEQLYEIRYRHAQDHKNYKHPFQQGVRVTLLKDGRAVIWHPSKPVWQDFPA